MGSRTGENRPSIDQIAEMAEEGLVMREWEVIAVGKAFREERAARVRAEQALRLLQEACDALVLTWRCKACGWETTLPVPGFGGDGHYHYEDGRTPCGPLAAARALLAVPEENK